LVRQAQILLLDLLVLTLLVALWLLLIRSPELSPPTLLPQQQHRQVQLQVEAAISSHQ
jgi:hypothetical protein